MIVGNWHAGLLWIAHFSTCNEFVFYALMCFQTCILFGIAKIKCTRDQLNSLVHMKN